MNDDDANRIIIRTDPSESLASAINTQQLLEPAREALKSFARALARIHARQDHEEAVRRSKIAIAGGPSGSTAPKQPKDKPGQAQPLTNLIKDAGISLNAAAILAALKKTDLTEIVEYESTSGSGEIKTFQRLTEAGLEFGTNRPTAHDFKTKPRFYPSRFPALLRIIGQQLMAEIEQLGARS